MEWSYNREENKGSLVAMSKAKAKRARGWQVEIRLSNVELRRSSKKNPIYFNVGPTLATFTPKLLIKIFWKLAGSWIRSWRMHRPRGVITKCVSFIVKKDNKEMSFLETLFQVNFWIWRRHILWKHPLADACAMIQSMSLQVFRKFGYVVWKWMWPEWTPPVIPNKRYTFLIDFCIIQYERKVFLHFHFQYYELNVHSGIILRAPK